MYAAGEDVPHTAPTSPLSVFGPGLSTVSITRKGPRADRGLAAQISRMRRPPLNVPLVISMRPRTPRSPWMMNHCQPGSLTGCASCLRGRQPAGKGIAWWPGPQAPGGSTPVITRHGSSDLVYHGYRHGSSGPVVALESPDGTRVGILQHVVRHSPSGLNWGFHGSGACDTAWSLLIDALGDGAICPSCRGTGRVVYVTRHGHCGAEPFDPGRHPWSKHGWQCECSGGYRHLPYGKFAGQFVARWGDEWSMSRSDVLSWLAAQATAITEAAGT